MTARRRAGGPRRRNDRESGDEKPVITYKLIEKKLVGNAEAGTGFEVSVNESYSDGKLFSTFGKAQKVFILKEDTPLGKKGDLRHDTKKMFTIPLNSEEQEDACADLLDAMGKMFCQFEDEDE